MNATRMVNPMTPLAYLSPDLGRQYSVTTYVEIGSVGALLWDILINVDSDYKLLFKRKITFATFAYFLSRASVLVYTLLNTIFQTAPLGKHCHTIERTLCVLLHVASASTALLFLLRVLAVYNRNKYILAFFLFLWLGVVGASLTAATVGGATMIGPTQYCLPKSLNSYVSAAPIAFAVFDTFVFLAISWRLLDNSWLGPKRRLKLMSGRYLPRFTRLLLQDGQIYYLIIVSSNLAVVVITFIDELPPTYRFMFVFNSALTNMMACRVYRNTKFGEFREDFVSTKSMEFALPSDSEFTHSTAHSTSHSSSSRTAVSDGSEVDREPRAEVNDQSARVRKWALYAITALMLGLPFTCIYLCKHFKDH